MCSSARSIASTLPDELKPNRPKEAMSETSSASIPTAANKKSIVGSDIPAVGYIGCFDRYISSEHAGKKKGATCDVLYNVGGHKARMCTILIGDVVDHISLPDHKC